jgi:predicted small lipoprotein YifL
MHHSPPLPRRSVVRTGIVPIVVGISLLSTACGLKAPLYLPDEKEQEVAPTDQGTNKRRVIIPRPAPQGPKQDRIDAGKATNQTAPTPPADPDRSATPPPPGT